MPDADEEELKEATVNFRAYSVVLYRIFLRLEVEDRLDEIKSFDSSTCEYGKCKFD